MCSATLVDPNPFPLSTYEEIASLRFSGAAHFPALDALGYDDYQPIKVYETSRWFTEKSKSTTIFSPGTSAAVVAGFWNVGVAIAKGYLTVASVILDASDYLQEMVEPVRDHEYYFYGGIEVTIYDPTVENTAVEVINSWGQGVYTLIYQRVYDGYDGAQWGISAGPNPFNQSYST